MEAKSDPEGLRQRRTTAVLIGVAACVPAVRIWLSIPLWAGDVVQLVAFGGAFYLLWRQRATRRYLLAWFAIAIVVVGTLAWFHSRA